MSDTKTMSLRLPPELADRIDVFASTNALSRNAAIVHLCEEQLGGEMDVPLVTQPMDDGHTSAHTVAPYKAKACPHPKDQEQRMSWGTVCGQCKRKLR
jgi:hypothetical protein